VVDAGDVDCGGVADGEFVVAGGEPAVVFEVVEAALDGVSVLVPCWVEGWGSAAGGAASSSVSGLVGWHGDGRRDLVSSEPGAVGAGGVGLVGEDSLGSLPGASGSGAGDADLLEHGDELWAVAVLTRGEQEREHPTVLVDRGVGLGAPPAAGATQGVVVGFSHNPFHAVSACAGGVDVGAGGGGVHGHLPGQLSRGVGGFAQCGFDAAPDPEQLPAREQGVHAPPRAVPVGDVSPWTTGSNPVTDPVDQASHRPLPGPADPAGGWDQGFEQRPLGVGEVVTDGGIYRGHEASLGAR